MHIGLQTPGEIEIQYFLRFYPIKNEKKSSTNCPEKWLISVDVDEQVEQIRLDTKQVS